MSQIKETSTNNRNRRYLQEECSLTYAALLVGGRWKLIIINQLLGQTLRFSELRQRIPLITERMLTLQLREMEADGLVQRAVYAEVPPRVEYSLTSSGAELLPIWHQLADWGERHRAARAGGSPPPTPLLQ